MSKSAEDVELMIRASAHSGWYKVASVLRRYPPDVILEVIEIAAHRYDTTHLNREQEARKAVQRAATRHKQAGRR